MARHAFAASSLVAQPHAVTEVRGMEVRMLIGMLIALISTCALGADLTAPPTDAPIFRGLVFGEDVRKQVPECPHSQYGAGKRTCWQSGCWPSVGNDKDCRKGGVRLQLPAKVLFAEDSIGLSSMDVEQVDGKLAALSILFHVPVPEVETFLRDVFVKKYGQPKSRSRIVQNGLGAAFEQKTRRVGVARTVN